MLSSYFSRDKVVELLVRQRCKYASKQADITQKNEFIQYHNREYLQKKNFENTVKFDDKTIIYSLFPSRSKWCHIGKYRTRLDSVKRNERKLYNTYLKAKNENSKEDWYLHLCEFADNIVRITYNPEKNIPAPRVHILEKKRNKNEITCRPICIFPLKIKVILSLLNKYLTDVLDNYFHPCSFAFRKPRPERGNFQHLNAVKSIKYYREKHIGKPLFVAECDMQKFYDTIDHNVIKLRFNQLMSKVKKDRNISHKELKIVKRWFYNYVDCFNFYDNVYRFNKYDSTHMFWRSIPNRKDKKCKIEWIENFFVNGKYINSRKKRLGVPQGGPLSGCIANIVMHFVDNSMINSINKKDILYLRFCDDMILIGKDKTEVSKIFTTYQEKIHSSKLYKHPSEHLCTEAKMRNFWEAKTRDPYEWNEKGEHAFPWITFVGFDINWCGNLRIRKSSLKKQIIKQHTTNWELLKHYKKGKLPKYCSATIKASLTNRQIGMSVGRVEMWNYKGNSNMHSWASAFSILDENPWSIKQLKSLDRHRQKVLHRTESYLSKIKCPAIKKRNDSAGTKIAYYGKPYSYFGQCFTYK